ncbi:hypothetical protein PR202_ga17981 [Eleusine coracana subsp. coracana]|uniref:Fe2OG dioxygenase domain-containing protein n=1 Tax=Eleusine coracana subsp. coracana TaxID=191504 RepID=A0AAV5CQT8_ELECO|nr:hypothetical protein PR202_ga17981 [Eleusine coracana subsp. coracana]
MAGDGDQEQPWKIPPIVQELASGVQAPPSRYVVREQDRPDVAGAVMPEPIPLVDLSRLSAASDDPCPDEVAKLRSALQNWGLFLAVGHGMEPSFVAEMMNVTKGFYKLPMEEKQKYSNLVNGREFRIEGYGNDIVLSENQTLDWCDRFYIIVEPESRKVHSLWPTQPPSFSDTLREYTARCREIVNLVLANMAKLVGLHERYFVDMLDEDAVTYARLNYYPHCPEPNRVFGLKPHSDASLITVVLTDDTVNGLQVQGDDSVWYDVPIVPNALLINVGDVIEGSDNLERERVSLVMFYSMEPEKEIEPAPELVDEERPSRYRKTKTKDYIAELFETLARGTRALDKVKI